MQSKNIKINKVNKIKTLETKKSKVIKRRKVSILKLFGLFAIICVIAMKFNSRALILFHPPTRSCSKEPSTEQKFEVVDVRNYCAALKTHLHVFSTNRDAFNETAHIIHIPCIN